MDNIKKKNIFQKFNSLFEYKESSEYKFTIPENPDEEKDKNISYSQEIEQQKPKNEAKNIFPTISVNLEYIQNKYNTLINSDIITREFKLVAKNKEYNAFLIYIDGMVNTTLINDFILEPLMLRNRANTFDENDTKIVSEAVTNNISVKRVKKFNLLEHIFSSLMPQNSVKKIQDFDEIISRYKFSEIALYLLIL